MSDLGSTQAKPGQAFFLVHWSNAPNGVARVLCQHNPTQITLEKGVQLAEINIPGLTAPLQQFVRGQAETLNVELFFDTSDHGMGNDTVSVTTLTDPIYAMTRIDPKTHAPPIVDFFWGLDSPGSQLPDVLESQRRYSFTGVVSSVRQNFTMWSTLGAPLRAKLTLTIKEYLPLDQQLDELDLSSPDKTHSHVVAVGQTLGAIAHRYYTDSTQWREIADANAIDDPRRMMPGRQLTVPSIPAQ
jgi:nucleoid-associated protein YgaU